MTEYHIAYGEMPTAIYAGTQNKKGDWVNRNEVTEEAIEAVCKYFIACAKNENTKIYGKEWNITATGEKVALLVDMRNEGTYSSEKQEDENAPVETDANIT